LNYHELGTALRDWFAGPDTRLGLGYGGRRLGFWRGLVAGGLHYRLHRDRPSKGRKTGPGLRGGFGLCKNWRWADEALAQAAVLIVVSDQDLFIGIDDKDGQQARGFGLTIIGADAMMIAR